MIDDRAEQDRGGEAGFRDIAAEDSEFCCKSEQCNPIHLLADQLNVLREEVVAWSEILASVRPDVGMLQ